MSRNVRRILSMNEMVYGSLKKAGAPSSGQGMVDGYSVLIMLDKNGNLKVALHIENEMCWAMEKYKKLLPDSPLLHITPRVFRYTFCIDYANDGMDIKNLQYLMGN